MEPFPPLRTKKVGSLLIWYFCYTFWPCSCGHQHRLLATKWQHSWLFSGLSTAIFNIQRNKQWKIAVDLLFSFKKNYIQHLIGPMLFPHFKMTLNSTMLIKQHNADLSGAHGKKQQLTKKAFQRHGVLSLSNDLQQPPLIQLFQAQLLSAAHPAHAAVAASRVPSSAAAGPASQGASHRASMWGQPLRLNHVKHTPNHPRHKTTVMLHTFWAVPAGAPTDPQPQAPHQIRELHFPFE